MKYLNLAGLPFTLFVVVITMGAIPIPLTTTLSAQYQWLPTSELSQPRQRHSATLLQDGRVLVAGGAYDFWGESVTGTCEIYDPANSTWSTCASMTTPRSSHTAMLLDDGRVLVIGGYGGTGYANASCEIYDPIADTWSAVTAMNTPRYRHRAVMLNNDQVLVVGGRRGNIDGRTSMSIWGPVSACEMYTISTDTWTEVAAMNQPRVESGLALLSDGRVLVAGGINDRDIIDNWAQPSTASCEIYDPVTNTWAYTDAFQSARNYVPIVNLANNSILSVGGELDKQSLSASELFDANAERWNGTGHMEDPRIIAEVVTLADGNIITIGGWSYLWSSQTSTTETYSVTDQSWTVLPPMDQKRGWHTATLLTTGDILVVGGTGPGGAALTSCELLRPQPRGSFKVFAIGDIPNDEGNKVRIYWSCHPNDKGTKTPNNITSYEVYLQDDNNGEKISGLPQGKWKLVGNTKSTTSNSYSIVAPTIGNSKPENSSYSIYIVVAKNASGGAFVTAPAIGESFDNRGPAIVQNVSVIREGAKSIISWNAPESSYIEGYAIYRSDKPNFPICPDYVIGTTAQTTFTDGNVEEKMFYRVRALDDSRNPGYGSYPVNASTSQVMNSSSIVPFSMGKIYPVPTIGTLNLPINASEPVSITIALHNALSQAVIEPVVTNLVTGEQVVQINVNNLPSGTYHCVIETGQKVLSVPVSIQR